MAKRLFTSESVTEGHPDKICDQISDAVLDEALSKDPGARVAIETAATTGMVLVMGEMSTSCYVDIPKIARKVIIDIGYNQSDYGFDGNTCAVLTAIDEQSSDIALGVNKAMEYKSEANGQNGIVPEEDLDSLGAGDQGIMFGYASNETPELMPMAISYAHKLAAKMSQVRKDGELEYLRPDGKTQVTVEYEGDRPVRIDTIVISSQHHPAVKAKDMKNDIIEKIIKPIIPEELLDSRTNYYVNPTGRFVVGGPHGDSGLTGRKIIVDTYGGYGNHGGGSFSGKDPTKVDRSASYMARYIAKNIVAAGLADKCEIQFAYAIGVAKPVSVFVDSFGTGKISDEDLQKLIDENFDLRPGAIIRNLNLRRPIYRQLAAYGHFGRPELDLPWEKIDEADRLLK